jgi:hypothetical protein
MMTNSKMQRYRTVEQSVGRPQLSVSPHTHYPSCSRRCWRNLQPSQSLYNISAAGSRRGPSREVVSLGFSRGSSATLSVGAPWSHGIWSIKLMIALVNFIVIVKVRLVIVLRQRRTYTGPIDSRNCDLLVIATRGISTRKTCQKGTRQRTSQ